MGLRAFPVIYAKDVEGFYWIGESTGRPRAPLLVALKLAAQLYWMALLAGFAAAVADRALRRRLAVPLGALAAFTAVYLVYFGSSRFHFLMAPWLHLGAGAFVAARLARRVPSLAPAPRVAGA